MNAAKDLRQWPRSQLGSRFVHGLYMSVGSRDKTLRIKAGSPEIRFSNFFSNEFESILGSRGRFELELRRDSHGQSADTNWFKPRPAPNRRLTPDSPSQPGCPGRPLYQVAAAVNQNRVSSRPL